MATQGSPPAGRLKRGSYTKDRGIWGAEMEVVNLQLAAEYGGCFAICAIYRVDFAAKYVHQSRELTQNAVDSSDQSLV